MRLSRYVAASAPVIDGHDGIDKRVVMATRSAEVRILSEFVWRCLNEGALEQLPEAVLKDLVDAELLVPSAEDELQTILARNRAATADSGLLYVVIQPTAACQLGCSYCGQVHTKKALDDTTQDLLVARVASRLTDGGYRRLQIGWFGAEPLLGIAGIRSLSPRLRDLARAHGADYSAKVVTNGLALTLPVARELVELGVRHFEVTLDGDAGFHDARRHRKGGQSTFDEIYSHVVDVARAADLREVRLSIRCNVDRHNAAGVSPLLKLLAAAGLQRRLSFYVAPIHSWGNDAHLRSIEKYEFADAEIDWFIEMLALGFEVSLIPALKPTVCLAVTQHGEVIDAYGEVYNCTEVPYVPLYRASKRFSLGSLATGVDERARDELGTFSERIVGGTVPCASCRMLPVCGGACPKQWLEGLEPCPTPKYNIEKRLLLAYTASRRATQPAAQL